MAKRKNYEQVDLRREIVVAQMNHIALKHYACIIDHLAGNSFVENLFSSELNPSLSVKFYDCTPEKHATLRLLVESTSNERYVEAWETHLGAPTELCS